MTSIHANACFPRKHHEDQLPQQHSLQKQLDRCYRNCPLASSSNFISNMSGVPPPGAAPANLTVQQMQQMQQMMQQQQQQQMAAANPAVPQAPTSSQAPAAAPVPSAAASQPPQDLGNLPIRAYLDQTVVPILLDGKEGGCGGDE